MPHKCTHCGEIFEDGSPEILKGCPACGGKKFLYVREEDHPVDQLEEKPAPVAEAVVNSAGMIEELGDDREIVAEQTVPKRPAHKEREKDIFDRLESISINGPGSYEINIEKLAQNGGVVLGLGKEGQYAVDIISMGKLRKKDKK